MINEYLVCTTYLYKSQLTIQPVLVVSDATSLEPVLIQARAVAAYNNSCSVQDIKIKSVVRFPHNPNGHQS